VGSFGRRTPFRHVGACRFGRSTDQRFKRVRAEPVGYGASERSRKAGVVPACYQRSGVAIRLHGEGVHRPAFPHSGLALPSLFGGGAIAAGSLDEPWPLRAATVMTPRAMSRFFIGDDLTEIYRNDYGGEPLGSPRSGLPVRGTVRREGRQLIPAPGCLMGLRFDRLASLASSGQPQGKLSNVAAPDLEKRQETHPH
jgi:hypothetical protein